MKRPNRCWASLGPGAASSFTDVNGALVRHGDRLFRLIPPDRAAPYRQAFDDGLIAELVADALGAEAPVIEDDPVSGDSD